MLVSSRAGSGLVTNTGLRTGPAFVGVRPMSSCGGTPEPEGARHQREEGGAELQPRSGGRRLTDLPMTGGAPRDNMEQAPKVGSILRWPRSFVS